MFVPADNISERLPQELVMVFVYKFWVTVVHCKILNKNDNDDDDLKK